MGTFGTRIRELWNNMSRPNQIMLVGAIGAALLVAVGFVYWAGSPDYVPLVTNPSQSDSAAILSQLKDRRIVYRISPDGGTIEVPASQRAELRMQLASAGLLNSGSLGFEGLKSAPFGQTQEMEQQTINHALEGEMENSIASLAPVQTARVKYAPGDNSSFLASDKKDPSASIVVHTKAGQELTKANIRAIVNMVARGYTGLTTHNVSMVDGAGSLLWDGSEDNIAAGIEDRQAQERAYKEAMMREIQSHIRAVVGPNKSTVVVRAELDFDRKTEKRVEVTPGAPTSNQTSTETLKGAGTLGQRPQQPAGAAANTGGAPGAPTYQGNVQTADSSGSYSQETSNRAFDNNKTEVDSVHAPGEVKSLAVSLLLDSSVKPEAVTAIEKDVRTFIGADTTPGTRTVSVQSVPFDNSVAAAEAKAAETAASSERMNRIVSYGVPVALMLVMLIILARGMKKLAPGPQLAIAGAGGPTLALGGVGGMGGAAGTAGLGLDVAIGDYPMDAAGIIGLPPADNKSHTFEMIEEAFDADLESISHLARSSPETVAALIKSWISDER